VIEDEEKTSSLGLALFLFIFAPEGCLERLSHVSMALANKWPVACRTVNNSQLRSMIRVFKKADFDRIKFSQECLENPSLLTGY
jgi:hypothetical protein